MSRMAKGKAPEGNDAHNYVVSHPSTPRGMRPGSSQSSSSKSSGVRPATASELYPFEYDLLVRQQPKQAKLCTGNDKQPKGPVDPPPVLRLQISRNDKATTSPASSSPDLDTLKGGSATSSAANSGKLTSASLIQSPYLFCFAALCKAEEDKELYLQPDGKSRYVTGNTVSSLYHLRDPKDGSAEGFFVFPDIGVRIEGVFRLKMSLYEMVDATVHHCKTVYTEPFHVYSAKKYPGLEDPTELSKSFANQGLKMRIKGGPARGVGRGKETSSRPSTSGTEEPPAQSELSMSLKRPYTAEDERSDAIRRKNNADAPSSYHRYLQSSVQAYRPSTYAGYTEPERDSYQEPPRPEYATSTFGHISHQDRRPLHSGQYPSSQLYSSHYPRPITAPAEPSPCFRRDHLPPSPTRMAWPPPPTPVEYYRSAEMGPSKPSVPQFHRSQSDHRRIYRPPYPVPSHSEYNALPGSSYAHSQSGLPRPQTSYHRRPGTAESSRLTLPPLAEAVSREHSPAQGETPYSTSQNEGRSYQPSSSASSSLRSLLNPDPPSEQVHTKGSGYRQPPLAPHDSAMSASEEDTRYYENKARQQGRRISWQDGMEIEQ